MERGKSRSYWLARFNRKMLFHFPRKMLFHFPRVFPLISDRSVWHNGMHPRMTFQKYRLDALTTELWETRGEQGHILGSDVGATM